MSYATSKANKELKEILSQYVSKYKVACDLSRENYLKTLSPGARVPEHDKLYTQADRDAFEAECCGLREKASKITEDLCKDLRAKSTEAPSTEAVNTITLLGARKNVTESEIRDLINQYGADCPQAWRAIKDIADSHDIHVIGNHPVDGQLKAIEDVGSSIYHAMSAANATRTASNGFAAFIGMSIDEALPME